MPSVVLAVAAVYLAFLAGLAIYGNRTDSFPKTRQNYGYVLGLSIAVYCTSWTFFGAVGTAVRSGIDYLPIYLGPALVFLFGFGLLRRMVSLGRGQHTTSIADFISARFGNSQLVAALISLTAAAAFIPYIALQLRAISTSFAAITYTTPGDPPESSLAAVVITASLLTLFAIVFGARTADATHHNRGLILAIAAESVVKLFALLVIAIFAVVVLLADTSDNNLFAAQATIGSLWPDDRFVTLTLLSAAAILCLPRQFHVLVVACQDEAALPRARRVFLVYMLLVALVVVPIAMAGLLAIEPAKITPDLFVLHLPMLNGQPALALLAFIGGLSAATAMVILEAIALSTMISNDLVVPALLKSRLWQKERLFPRFLIVLRWGIIAVLMILAVVYHESIDSGRTLADIGTISFALAAQFLPPLLLGLYWKKATARGALAGVLAGAAVWLVCLFLPSYAGVMAQGDPMSAWQAPFAALGIPFLAELDPLTQGVGLSLALNVLALYAMSLAPQWRRAPRSRALPERTVRLLDVRELLERFIGSEETGRFLARSAQGASDTDLASEAVIAEAEQQLVRVLGAPSAHLLVTWRLKGMNVEPENIESILAETSERQRFSREILEATLENMAQGVCVIGPDFGVRAWNRRYEDLFTMPPGMLRVGLPFGDVLRYFAQIGEFGAESPADTVEQRLDAVRRGVPFSSQRQRLDGGWVRIEGSPMAGGGYVFTYTDITANKTYEKKLEESERAIRFYTDNAPSMIAFVKADGTIAFANRAYREHFGLAEDGTVGKQSNAFMTDEEQSLRQPYTERALEGEEVKFDLTLKTPERKQRHMQITYIPQKIDGGVTGFYAFYHDVTAMREAEMALKAAKETLEERVAERTLDLEQAAQALEEAKQRAEEATHGKTRFLAAASHDLRQPLNAARLFASALGEEIGKQDGVGQDLVINIEQSIDSADRLLRALLDISKLDAGALQPQRTSFPLQDLLRDVSREFSAVAARKGLRLTVVPSSLWVVSDRGLLLSVLQNLTSNAIRYTEKGGVLIGARRRGRTVSIEVWDTGLGIPKDKQTYIFEEFRRLERDRNREQGFGLGLAIVERIVHLLDHQITVQSNLGRGSVFAVAVPMAQARLRPKPKAAPRAHPLDGRYVLAIDNEPAILSALRALLTRWGCRVATADSLETALAIPDIASDRPDLMLLDYHLDNERTGIEVLHRLSELWGTRVPTILISADTSSEMAMTAARESLHLLRKPVTPAELRALMSHLTKQAAE